MIEITNREDIIDSREITERIEYLEKLEDDDKLEDYEVEELNNLRNLQDQWYSNESWTKYGVTLIKDDYFEDYAREFAEDIGAISKDTEWPNTCIDWERASDELKNDYTLIDFDGVDYFARE